MAKVALILAGCGVQDGSEIHESVLCLLALYQAGHEVQCFAPDIPQTKVVNHLSGEEETGSRNVLIESARIARGEIEDLAELEVDGFDAVLIPGGFGAALNLSSFALEQAACQVHDALRAVLEAFYAAKKPIGCTCISPMILAKVFEGKQSLRMTVGQAPGAIEQLEAMGMEAVPAAVTEMIADEANRIYTTPCYMEPDDLPGMFEGIKKLVEKLG